jgi:hypothetical protein
MSKVCRVIMKIYRGMACLDRPFRRLSEKALVRHLCKTTHRYPESTVRAAVRRLHDRRALKQMGSTGGSPVYELAEERGDK